jgi:sulfite reductase (NADPH) flavoprotein alpha-component
MIRNVIFQLHWLLGITAGVVLAVVGVTGAMLSFEHGVLKAINDGVMTVPVAGRTPLAPAELVARIARAEPGKAIMSLTLATVPGESARVVLAPAPGAPSSPGGRPRGESRYVDPYSGELLGPPRGEGFFRTTMQVHRWLAADAVGKQVVGASTLALVFFCVSGLYLRWPRRWWDWRKWLQLHWRLKGRGFLRQLHVVVGTWLVLAYLLMSLTGLFWSYGWYREGLYTLTGTPVPAPRGGAPQAPRADPAPAAPPLDIAAAFATFDAAVPARSLVTLRWPASPGQPVEFSYQDPDPAHERANHRLLLDANTLAVATHERHEDKPFGQRIMAGIFPLHSGSFFGTAGLVLFFLASLAMPLFTITGWQLYLDRRAKKKRRRVAPARV